MRRALVLLAGLALAFTSVACQASVFELKVGDCFGGASGTTVANVDVVDCAKPHDDEVYFIFDYPSAPSDYPGDAAVSSAGQDGCLAPFATYVGIDYNSTTAYAVTILKPTSDTWATGDHAYDCLITSADGSQLTGSAKGTNK